VSLATTIAWTFTPPNRLYTYTPDDFEHFAEHASHGVSDDVSDGVSDDVPDSRRHR
jgi:hypothetical protein